MAKQTFTAGQTLTAQQMNDLQTNDFNLSVSTQTANYTLQAADKGTREVMNMGSAGTVTVPNSTFNAGDMVWLHNIGAGQITVAAGTGVTLNALSTTLVQWQGATLYATSASSFILFPTGGATKVTNVDQFTASGTWTVPAGVTYAIAHIRAGGGGVGISASGNGGDSSVAFASGTATATGGLACNNGDITAGSISRAGQANSGNGAFANRPSTSANAIGGDGAYIVHGAAVTPAASITITVGAGGTAGSNGAAGGSGYVWIEYQV